MNLMNKKVWFGLFSGGLIAFSIYSLLAWGLKPGIDFTGGVLIEANFSNDSIERVELIDNLKALELSGLVVQKTQGESYLIRFVSDDDNLNAKVQEEIKNFKNEVIIEKVEFISSSISSELRNKAMTSVVISIIGIALYVAWAFRKVSYPISSWIYGSGAILALFHDVIITLGVFSFLGKFYAMEVNISFIAALLTILGYSVNDTIVIFDRIRENLTSAGAKKEFEETVNRSIQSSLGRSLNTSLTVIIVLLSIIFFGGESIKDFSVALLVGIISGHILQFL